MHSPLTRAFSAPLALSKKTFLSQVIMTPNSNAGLNDRAADSGQVRSGCSQVREGHHLACFGPVASGWWWHEASGHLSSWWHSRGRLVLQLAPKCPIFHGSAEPSATDAQTHGESTSLPVLYTHR